MTKVNDKPAESGVRPSSLNDKEIVEKVIKIVYCDEYLESIKGFSRELANEKELMFRAITLARQSERAKIKNMLGKRIKELRVGIYSKTL